MVDADNPAEGDAVEALRRAILCEYADTVFNPEVEIPPPVRGPRGEATITLKPGAVPIKQRMFQMHGERKDKWAELVTELERDGKLEDGISAWNSPSFPVPKKGPGSTGSWSTTGP